MYVIYINLHQYTISNCNNYKFNYNIDYIYYGHTSAYIIIQLAYYYYMHVLSTDLINIINYINQKFKCHETYYKRMALAAYTGCSSTASLLGVSPLRASFAALLRLSRQPLTRPGPDPGHSVHQTCLQRPRNMRLV